MVKILIDANKNKNEVVEKKRQKEFMTTLDSIDLTDKKVSEDDKNIEIVRTGIIALQKDIKNLENGVPLTNAKLNDALEKINNDVSKNNDQKKAEKQQLKDLLNAGLSKYNKMRDQLLSPIDQFDPKKQADKEEEQEERYNRATNIVKKLHFEDADFVDNTAVKA